MRNAAANAGMKRQPTARAVEKIPLTPAQLAVRIILAAILVLGTIWATGYFYFKDHLFPGTVVGDKDISLMEPATALSAIESFESAYSLRITGYGLDHTFSPAELGITFSKDPAIAEKLRGNPVAWPIECITSHKVTAQDLATTDESIMRASVDAVVAEHNATATQPTAAQLSFDEASNMLTVTNASAGTTLNPDAVFTSVRQAAAAWQTKVELPNGALATTDAASSTATLEAQAAAFNKAFNLKATLNVGSAAIALTNKDAMQWVEFGANGTVTFKENLFEDWFNKLANQFNTTGGDRTYTRSDGKVVAVTGGTYGGWAVDKDALRAGVETLVNPKTGAATGTASANVSATTEGKGHQGANGPDWGNRYIDVDITEQHTRMYDDTGKIIWETDCITGWDNGYYDTPTGVYVINSKQSPSVLQSSISETITNDDGTTEERVTTFRHDVDYWMPFISNFIGFHDASWQTGGWGGDLYHEQLYGSGGCVNLPTDKAGELYDLIVVGDIVSVHF